MTRTLITGGVRSGKSAYAEALLAGFDDVLFVATGPAPDPDHDPEWSARVAAHQLRRPPTWQTLETTDVTAALRASHGPVLIDCLGTWLTQIIDELDTWDQPLGRWQDRLDERLDPLLDAWRSATGPLAAVTNEVGWGVVPDHSSGRLFRDVLGLINQRFAEASDDVILLVAGRPLRL